MIMGTMIILRVLGLVQVWDDSRFIIAASLYLTGHYFRCTMQVHTCVVWMGSGIFISIYIYPRIRAD